MPTQDTRHNPRGEVRLESSSRFILVTPSDSADNITEGGVSYISRGISFGTAGTLKLTRPDGTAVTIPSGALAAGIIHPICAVRIWSTGTSAADIVAYV